MANLNWKTPFEVLHGFAPNIEDLRTIGCLCYAANIGESGKFEARAQKCVLLGYAFGFKVYKLYDLQSKKFFHSQDVIFQEQVFPFRHQVQPSGTDHSIPSFLWPNSESSTDSPRHSLHQFAPIMLPHDSVSTQSAGSEARSAPLQAPNSFISSPSSTIDSHIPRQTETVNLKPFDHRPLIESQQRSLRRSTRSKVVPTWLKDFVQTRSTRVQQASSSSS